MAIQVGLSAYKIQIKKKHDRAVNGKDPWWSFCHGSPTDGFTETHNYLQDRESGLFVYEENRVLRVSDLASSRSGRRIDGILTRGEAGLVQDLIDIETHAHTYTKDKSEAALSPFYFRFHLEDGRPWGIVLLQSTGQSGVKRALERDMQAYFNERAPDPLTVRLTQIVDAMALNKFVANGSLQDVILVNRGKKRRSRSALQRNSVGADTLGNEGDKLEMHLGRRGGWSPGTFRRVIDVAMGRAKAKDLVKAEGMSEFDDMRVTLRVGKRDQTFSLLNPDDSPIRYDITDRIKTGKDGYPTVASLRTVAAEVYQELLDTL